MKIDFARNRTKLRAGFGLVETGRTRRHARIVELCRGSVVGNRFWQQDHWGITAKRLC